MAKTKAFELAGEVSVDPRRAAQGLKEIERLAQQTGRALSSSFDSAGRTLDRGFLPGLSHVANVIQSLPTVGRFAHSLISPLKQAAEEGIRFNMTMENAVIGLEGVAGSADKARGFIAKLQAEAEKTPFEFTGLLRSVRYMNTFGFSLDEMIPKLRAWGNVVAASGDLSEETLLGVVRAFGQMKAKNSVSAEEMEQLAERGVPSWELLAKAIGKTVAETRKLSELGRLRGGAAVEAITAMAGQDPRFKDMMGSMSNTLAGRLSNLEDVRARSAGQATQALTKDLNNALAGALSQSNLAERMAGGIDAAIGPVSGMIKTAFVGVVSGGITGGMKEGIQATQGVVFKAVEELGLGTLTTMMRVLGIQSPSKEFAYLGEMAGQGFMQGLTGALKKFDFGPEIEKIILEAAAKFNLDPNLIRAVIWKESAGRSRAVSSAGARGLMQLMPGTAARYGVRSDELYNPRKNIMAGSAYLADLLQKFGGRTDLALAGYNAGEGRGKSRTPEARLSTLIEKNIDGVGSYVRQITQAFEQLSGRRVGVNEPVPVKIVGWDGAAAQAFGSNVVQMAALAKRAPTVDASGYAAPLAGSFPISLPGLTGSGPMVNLSVDEEMEILKLIGPTITQGFQQGAAAAGSFFDSVVKQSDDFKVKWTDISDAGRQAFTTFFTDLNQGLNVAWQNALLGFLQTLQEMAAAAAAQRIVTMIGNLVGGLFGGGLPSGGLTPGSLTAMALGGLAPGSTARGYAAGTSSARAGWALVGEAGPELVNMRGGERVYSNAETRAMMGGGPVTINVYGVRNPSEFLSAPTQSQIQRKYRRALQGDAMRGGR